MSVIDLHCHLLPGLDDGPTSMPEAFAMARVAAASGTTTIVATPHIDHRWGVRPHDLPRRGAALADALREEGIELELRTSGEIAISRLADLSGEELDSLRLGDGRYLLVESPMNPADADFDVLLLKVQERGESIVLAHRSAARSFSDSPSAWPAASTPASCARSRRGRCAVTLASACAGFRWKSSARASYTTWRQMPMTIFPERRASRARWRR